MTKAVRRADTATVLGVVRRNRPALMMSTALQAAAIVVVSLPALAQPAPNARPTGGTVVGGQATIGNTATTTTIAQTTQKTAIDWQSFNVGNQQTVLFVQPNASAIALNRVVGPDPSQIAGKITANGQIIIQNQSGVMFLDGAQVNTSGLMVTAVGISNGNFMAGNMVFDQAANPNARVVNQGTLTVRGAGLAALVAPAVANSGTINAKMGNVVLAGAQAVTLDMYGDGLVSVNVTRQVTQAPDGVNALVTNTGVIRAKGGTVTLTAAAADGVVQNLVSAGGTIAANTVGNKTGTISIAGVGGNIEIAGQLGAEGLVAGTIGGAVLATTTGNVALRNTAVVSTSGKAGGGTVAIGTTLARATGGPSVTDRATANTVTMAAGATVRADATDSGNGGTIVILSRNFTSIAGAISAQGGSNGGNGGFIETSGDWLSIAPGAILRANARVGGGVAGTWLLDPLDLDVIHGGADAGVSASGSPFTVVPNATGAQIGDVTINTQLNGGTNVVLNTTGTGNGGTGAITVNAGASIAWSTATSLTLNAAGNIAFDGHAVAASPSASLILLAGGSVSQAVSTGAFTVSALAVTSSGNVSLTAGNTVSTVAGSVTGSGNSFTLNNSAASLAVGTVNAIGGITTNNGNVSLTTATSGNIVLGNTVNAGTAAVTLVSAGSIGVSGSGGITAGRLTGSAGTDVGLGLNNVLGTLGDFSVTAGQLSILTVASLKVDGSVTASTSIGIQQLLASGTLTIANGGSVVAPSVLLYGSGSGGIVMTGNASIGKAGGTVTLQSKGGPVTEATTSSIVTGTIVSTAVAGTNVATVSLLSPNNTIDAIGLFSVTGDFSLKNAAALNVNGSLNASGNIALQTMSGGITLNQGVSTSTGTIALNSAGTIGQGGGSIAATALVLTSAKAIALTGANAVGTLAASISNNGQDFAFNNTSASLTVDTVGGVTGIATNKGVVLLTTTTSGDIALNQNIGVFTANVTLISAGTIGQSGGSITANALAVTAANAVTLSGDNAVGTVAASVTGAGQGFSFNNTSKALPIDNVGAVTGITTNGGNVLLSTTSSGNIALNQPVNVTTGTVTLNSAGNVTQVASGTISAIALSGSAAGTIALQAHNTIGTVGSINATTFKLLSEESITIAAQVAATSLALVQAQGLTSSLTVLSTGTVAAPSITLSADSQLSLAGSAVVGQSGAVVDLNSFNSNIIQAVSSTIIAGTLQSSAGFANGGTLSGTANAIASIGSIALSSGNFLLVNTGSVGVGGPLTGASTVAIYSGTIGVTGSIGASTAISLAAGAGGIGLGIGHILSAPTIDLSAAGGGIAQTGAGTVSPSGILQSTSGATGTVSLLGTTNSIAAIGGFAVTGGDFQLATTSQLAVNGNLTASGNIFLRDTNATSKIAIGATGQVKAGTGSLASFQADAFTVVPGGSVTGGTFELAPKASGTAFVLGTGGNLVDYTGIGATNVRIGAVTLNGTLQSPTVSTIDFASNFGSSSVALDLRAAADVSQSPGSILTASTLTGNASGVALTVANAIGTLGNFISSGPFTLVNNQALVVAGTVTAGPTLSTPNPANNKQLSLTTNTGSIVIGVSAGAAGVLNAGKVVLNSAAGIAEPNGTIIASVLTASAVGDLILSGPSNNVTSFGGLSATGGNVVLVTGQTTKLTGLYTGNNLFFEAAVNGGTLQLGNGPAGATFSATAASNPRLTFVADKVTEGTTGGGTNAITATNGSVEVAAFNATNVTFGGASSPAYDNTFLGLISASGASSVSLGSFTDVPNGGTVATMTGSLTIAGTVAANNIALSAGTIGISGFVNAATVLSIGASGGGITESGSITAPTLIGVGTIAGGATLTGTNTIGALGNIALSSGTLAIHDTGNLSVAGTVAAPNVSLSAGTIGIPGFLNVGTTLALGTTGGAIAETGAIAAGTLVSIGSSTGNATLTGTNTIATLGSFNVGSGSFSLTDTGSLSVAGIVTAGAMSVNAGMIGIVGFLHATTSLALGASAGGIGETGSISTPTLTSIGTIAGGATLTGGNTIAVLGNFAVTGGDFSLTSNGSLNVSGAVVGPNIAIAAGTLSIGGFLNATTNVALGASAGGVTETGSIAAATLTSVGTIAGGATLTGSNIVATLGSFALTGGDFALTNTGSLNVAGVVTAPNISLNAGTIGIAGALNAGTVVALGASAGGVTESGSISAATLTSIGTVTGGITLTGTNTIATLGNFEASGDFILKNTGSVNVAGTVAAPNVSLNAGTVGISGFVNAGTTLALGASAGGIAESGSISAPTLVSIGTIAGGATLTGANTIGTLGGIAVSSGTLSVSSAGNIAVNGPISSDNDVVVLGTSATSNITVDGSVTGNATTGTIRIGGGSGDTTLANGHFLQAGTVDLFANGGTVIQQPTGSVVAGVLQSSGASNKEFEANSVLNTIGALGNIAVNGAIGVQTSGSVSVTGTLAAASIALRAQTIGISTTGLLKTDIVTGRVDLVAGFAPGDSGGISEAPGGRINAGVLTANDSGPGNVVLTGNNTITKLGAFSVAGDFSLVSTSGITVADLVSASNISLSSDGGINFLTAGQLVVNIPATGIVSLKSGAGISETSGRIVAGILTSIGTTTGGVTLTSTANTIAALGNFTVAGGDFALTTNGGISVAGTVSAPNISLNAGTIGIAGNLNAGTVVALGASAGGVTESGSISASMLVSNGTIAGGTTLNGSNTIATIGSLSYSGNLVLNDTVATTISGHVGDGPAVATSATIGAPGVTIGTGGVLNAGSVTITSTNGGVAETGTGQIVANSISIATTGTGDVSLTNPNNQILASNGIKVANGNLMLVDDPTLTLTGPYSANNLFFQVTQAGDTIALGSLSPATLTASTGGRISIVADNVTENASTKIAAASGTVEIAPFSTTVAMNLGSATQLAVDSTLVGNISTGTLTIGGYTDATRVTPGISITAANVTVAAATDLTGIANTLNILTLGSIAGTAAVTVGTLTGTAASSVDFSATSNNIGTLGSFSVGSGSFALVDSGNTGKLTVAGPVTASSVTITEVNTGTISVTGRIDGTTLLSLAAGSGGLSFSTGTVLSATTVDLSAAGGGIAQGAGDGIVATVLRSTSGVTGTVTLGNAVNNIATLGKFALTSGDFTLKDNGNLGNLTVSGPVTAGNVTIGGSGTVTVGGSIGATTALALSTGGIQLNSNAILSGATVDLSASGGGVTQAAGGSIVATTILQSTSGVTGTVSLDNTQNNVAGIGKFQVASGDFTLADTGNTGNLTVSGPLTAGNVSVTGAGTVTVTGSIGASATSLVLGSGAGGIALNAGAILTGTTVDLSATGGGVTQANGSTLAATVLTSSNGVNGTVSLPSTLNQIGTIGGLTVAGDLTVSDSEALTLAGKIVGSTVDIVTTAGGVTQAAGGTLIATTFASSGGLAGPLWLKSANNRIGTISAVTAIGTIAVVDSNALSLNGVVSAGAGTIDLSTTSGGVTQVGGMLIAATLTSSSNIAGTVSLTSGTNRIGSIAAFRSGGLKLNDSIGLTLAGTVSVGSAGTVDVTSAGGLNQTASGILIAGTLTSSGGLGASSTLAGTGNQIGSVSNIVVASGTFSLNDSIALAIGGKLSAHEFVVSDTDHTVSLADGTQIVTDGIARPAGVILPTDLPTATKNTNGGAYFTVDSFKQSGVLNAGNLNGSANILRIDATGTVALDPIMGLKGPDTWLIVGLIGSAVASGAINVKALDISFTGVGGGATLAGAVGGLTGAAAAGSANIEPASNGSFKINACAIHSVNCVLLPTQGVPQLAPSSEIVFAIPFIPNFEDNQDIVVPLVSDSNDTIAYDLDTDRQDKETGGKYRIRRHLPNGIRPISDAEHDRR
jgi:filamentous hemagglutinin family protein